jgi:hypothetical protein
MRIGGQKRGVVDVVIQMVPVAAMPYDSCELCEVEVCSLSYRVGLDIPADGRIVVSEVVLMQPRLAIEYLAREAQVVGNCSSRRALSYPTTISLVQSRT